MVPPVLLGHITVNKSDPPENCHLNVKNLTFFFKKIDKNCHFWNNAYAVLEQHRTAAVFLFYSLSSFSTFSFCLFATLTVLFLFLGASLVYVNCLARAADL